MVTKVNTADTKISITKRLVSKIQNNSDKHNIGEKIEDFQRIWLILIIKSGKLLLMQSYWDWKGFCDIGLVTTAALNTKDKEIQSKMPNCTAL